MRQTLARSLAAVFVSLLAGPLAFGQITSSWTGTTDGNWLTGSNWTVNTIPGSATTTTNTDTAVFSVATQPNIGLNLGTGGNYYLGAISATDATTRTIANSGTSGVLTLNGVSNTVINNSGTGTLTIAATNALTLRFGSAPVIQVAAGGTVRIDAPITQLGSGLTKEGSGLLLLTGANTYSGDTAVVAGTLELRGQMGDVNNGQVFVSGGTAVLSGGTGTRTTLGRVDSATTSVTNNGTIRADSAGGTNTFALRNLAFAGGSKLEVNIGATGSNSGIDVDSLNFNANNSGASVVKLVGIGGFDRAAGGNWTLGLDLGATGLQVNGGVVSEGAIFGTFTATGATTGTNTGAVYIDIADLNFALNSGDTFTLARTGNNLVLSFAPVPEPATVLAIGAAGLGAITWLRRRMRAEPTAVA